MIDTHSHPYLPEFESGGDAAVRGALASGVTHIVLPNVDLESVGPIEALHGRWPDVTSMAFGLHPTEVGEDWREVVDRIAPHLDQPGVVAVGEVGIDLYWDKTKVREQKEAFVYQLRLAAKRSLPVIIHCREGIGETLECLEEAQCNVPLVFHSFTGSAEDVKRIREVCDPMFGINGVVTYKSAGPLRGALGEIGLVRMVLETDAPYLSPVPHRGERNCPAYVVHTRDAVADVLGVSPETVDEVTTANARMQFRI